LLANLRWLSTARASYPRKITRKLAFHRFQGLSVEIIEEKNRENVIHSQFISTYSRSETRHFGGTQVVQINI
jgi:CTP-dependent riboflavin kinase